MEILKFIKTFITDFVIILGEMSPYLLLGFFFAGLLYAFLPRHKIEKYLNGNSFMTSVRAALFGIPLPLCSCGVIPTGVALYKNGASKGGTISFLISTPQTGIDSILATYSLLGLPFAIVRPFAALITGISGGVLTSKIVKEKKQVKHLSYKNQMNKTFVEKVKEIFRYGFVKFIQDIAKWLVIGLVLAAIISALVPNNFFEVLSLPPFYQMLLILVVSIPMYICATGSIPLAAVLIMKGLNPGAAFVLLMAGPATNAATITMIGKVLGKKSLITYLATIITGALFFGLAIDHFLPSHWFTQIVHKNLDHNHIQNLNWLQIISGITLMALIINAYIQRYVLNKKNSIKFLNNNTMQHIKIKVEGLTCNHCKTNVETNLRNLEFVSDAQVDLNDKTVMIKGDKIDIKKVKKVIESLGYKPMS